VRRWFEYRPETQTCNETNITTLVASSTWLVSDPIYLRVYYSWLYLPVMCIVPLVALSTINSGRDGQAELTVSVHHQRQPRSGRAQVTCRPETHERSPASRKQRHADARLCRSSLYRLPGKTVRHCCFVSQSPPPTSRLCDWCLLFNDNLYSPTQCGR